MKKTAKNKIAATFLGILIIIFGLGESGGIVFAQIAPSRENSLRGFQDRREMIPPAYAARYPFSAIVKIEVTFWNGEQGWGSGAMIGPNEVLTAEHVVYDRESNNAAKYIKVLPGYSSGTANFGAVYAGSYSHGAKHGCPAWTNCDIAVLNLNENIGYRTGWLGMNAFDNNFFSNVFMIGYPGDRDNGENMYGLQTSITRTTDKGYLNTLSYKDWTYGGMSGAPIFTINGYIIGIHTEGGTEANYGVALSTGLYLTVVNWKNRN